MPELERLTEKELRYFNETLFRRQCNTGYKHQNFKNEIDSVLVETIVFNALKDKLDAAKDTVDCNKLPSEFTIQKWEFPAVSLKSQTISIGIKTQTISKEQYSQDHLRRFAYSSTIDMKDDVTKNDVQLQRVVVAFKDLIDSLFKVLRDDSKSPETRVCHDLLKVEVTAQPILKQWEIKFSIWAEAIDTSKIPPINH